MSVFVLLLVFIVPCSLEFYRALDSTPGEPQAISGGETPSSVASIELMTPEKLVWSCGTKHKVEKLKRHLRWLGRSRRKVVGERQAHTDRQPVSHDLENQRAEDRPSDNPA